MLLLARWLLPAAFAAGAALMLLPPTATATATAAVEAWPTRPVHLVVGYPPGSSPDTLARLLADPLAHELGQPVVVDNKPGASGTIGVNVVARASDALTFGITTNGPLTTARQLFPKLPYDPVKDIQPLSLAAASPLVLGCSPSVPVTTVKEFISWARTQKDGVTYGTVGQGSGSHLTMALFAKKARLDMVHVPYQGYPQVMGAILGGQVQCSFMAPSAAMVQAKAGKFRLLAVSSPERFEPLPEVPTVAESAGIGGFQADLWIAAFGPSGMSPEVTARMSLAIQAALEQPEIREKLLQQGWQVVGGPASVLQKRISSDTEVWGAVIREAGIHDQ